MFKPQDKSRVERILSSTKARDALAHGLRGRSFRRTPSSGVDVHLHSNTDIVTEYGRRFNRLSLCSMHEEPEKCTVVFNEMNWNAPNDHPDELRSRFKGDSYREYLVTHEFGHVLGLGHVRDKGEHCKCNVMTQQTPLKTRCVVGLHTKNLCTNIKSSTPHQDTMMRGGKTTHDVEKELREMRWGKPEDTAAEEGGMSLRDIADIVSQEMRRRAFTHEVTLNKTKEEYEASIASAREEHKKATERLGDAHNQVKKHLEETMQSNIASMKSEHAGALLEQKTALEDKVNEIKRQMTDEATESGRVSSELTAELATINAQLQASKEANEALKAAQKAELDALQASLRSLAEDQAANSLKIIARQTEYENTINDHDKAVKNYKKAAELAEIAKNTSEEERENAKIEAENAKERIAELEAKMKDTDDEVAQLVAQLKEDITAANKKGKSRRGRNTKQTAKLKQEQKELRESLAAKEAEQVRMKLLLDEKQKGFENLQALNTAVIKRVREAEEAKRIADEAVAKKDEESKQLYNELAELRKKNEKLDIETEKAKKAHAKLLDQAEAAAKHAEERLAEIKSLRGDDAVKINQLTNERDETMKKLTQLKDNSELSDEQIKALKQELEEEKRVKDEEIAKLNGNIADTQREFETLKNKAEEAKAELKKERERADSIRQTPNIYKTQLKDRIAELKGLTDVQLKLIQSENDDEFNTVVAELRTSEPDLAEALDNLISTRNMSKEYDVFINNVDKLDDDFMEAYRSYCKASKCQVGLMEIPCKDANDANDTDYENLKKEIEKLDSFHEQDGKNKIIVEESEPSDGFAMVDLTVKISKSADKQSGILKWFSWQFYEGKATFSFDAKNNTKINALLTAFEKAKKLAQEDGKSLDGMILDGNASRLARESASSTGETKCIPEYDKFSKLDNSLKELEYRESIKDANIQLFNEVRRGGEDGLMRGDQMVANTYAKTLLKRYLEFKTQDIKLKGGGRSQQRVNEDAARFCKRMTQLQGGARDPEAVALLHRNVLAGISQHMDNDISRLMGGAVVDNAASFCAMMIQGSKK